MSEELIDFQIAALRQCMSDLEYEKKHLQKQMNANRQKAAECRDSIRRLEERRKKNERDQSHADAEPAAVVG